MGRLIQPVTEHVYIVLRLLTPVNPARPMATHRVLCSMLCHYGQSHKLFPIGGSVNNGETHDDAIHRHLRELGGIRLATNYPMLLVKTIDSYMEHEPVKIHMYMADVPFRNFRYRSRATTSSMSRQLGSELYEAQRNDLTVPIHTPSSMDCETIGGLTVTIYNWDTDVPKPDCFNWVEPYRFREAEPTISPLFVEEIPYIPRRDPRDEHGIWAQAAIMIADRILVRENHAI